MPDVFVAILLTLVAMPDVFVAILLTLVAMPDVFVPMAVALLAISVSLLAMAVALLAMPDVFVPIFVITLTLPTFIPPKVTDSDVPTDCPIDISLPFVISTPMPPVSFSWMSITAFPPIPLCLSQ